MVGLMLPRQSPNGQATMTYKDLEDRIINANACTIDIASLHRVVVGIVNFDYDGHDASDKLLDLRTIGDQLADTLANRYNYDVRRLVLESGHQDLRKSQVQRNSNASKVYLDQACAWATERDDPNTTFILITLTQSYTTSEPLATDMEAKKRIMLWYVTIPWILHLG
jgi:hypothetical protein